MAKKTQKDKNALDHVTFEQAIEKLNDIVQKIETGQVPLEESLRQYEQGMALIARCRRILQDAEKRIEIIHEGTQSEAAQPAESSETGESEEDQDAAIDDDEDIDDADEVLF